MIARSLRVKEAVTHFDRCERVRSYTMRVMRDHSQYLLAHLVKSRFQRVEQRVDLILAQLLPDWTRLTHEST